MKINLTFSIVLGLLSFQLSAQDYSEQARQYFGNRLTSSSMLELIATSLPSLEDCKMVFKEENAQIYYSKVEEMKLKIKEEKPDGEEFVEIDIEVFSTQDIRQGKGNYAGGMKSILDRLQPYIVFYKVEQLRTKGAEYGVAYKYWVKINDRWVFFPKPYNLFE